jgi:indolepyruvate ferredoxin oxidoreductase alpha subunit
MVEPADSKECKEYTKLAFELSEKYDVPVLVRLSTRVSHSQGLVEINDRIDYKLKDYNKDIKKYVMMPSNAIKRHVVVEERQAKLVKLAETDLLNKIENNNSKIGVITAGISYMYSKEALGNNVDYLKLGMVYPLPFNLIKEFCNNHDLVYIIEELDPFIEEHVKALGIINVLGKDKFSLLGEYTPQMIKKVILGVEPPKFNMIDEIPSRPPVMCAGCPHRGTFYVLKKLGLTVSGDIGCYTLGAVKPLDSLDSCICMGASVSAGFGMAKARGKEFNKKLVSVIGDSTFIHSGITSLIDIVYNKGANTIIILDNSITGMTGHQQNPTTGKTIRLEDTIPVNLIDLAHSIGVRRVKVADPFDVLNFEKIVKEEVNADEPSVIITQRPCALLKKVKYKGHCNVSSDCKKCKQCLKLGCPAISFIDNKIEIDETLCNGCGLCLNVCPFGAIKKIEG